MQATDVSQLALVVIAVGISLQTIVMVGGFIATVRVWRRLEDQVHEVRVNVNERLDGASVHLESAVTDLRMAARAVENLAVQAGGVVENTAGAARTVMDAVNSPRAMVLNGAASAARWLLSKMGPRRHEVRQVRSPDSAELF